MQPLRIHSRLLLSLEQLGTLHAIAALSLGTTFPFEGTFTAMVCMTADTDRVGSCHEVGKVEDCRANAICLGLQLHDCFIVQKDVMLGL